MSELFDLAILGGGPAGLTAAVYALHAQLKTALFSPDLGGKVTYPFALRGIPQIDLVWGAGLVRDFADRVSAELKNHIQDTVDRVEYLPNRTFRLHPSNGDALTARTVIVCTGVRAQRLFVAGESEYWGRGLSYSAVSHAPLFKDRDVAVIGGGDRAIMAVRILTPLARRIYYVAARPQRMTDPASAEHALSHPKVTVFQGWEVQQVIGDDFVTGIDLVGMNGEVRSMPVEGVFVQFGLLPNNAAVRDLVDVDANGHIIIDARCATSVPGLFAAGDVNNVCAEQVPVSIGDGAKAALAAWQHVVCLPATSD